MSPLPSRRAFSRVKTSFSRLSMSHEVTDVANPDILFTQLAACGTLLGAGFKVISDEKGESDGELEAKSLEVDIFRDTAVRYLGYANEIGEAFRPLIPVYIVYLSYAVAIAYVSADAVSKGYSCSKESAEECKTLGKPNICAIPATFDVLLFQMLASVVFPGFTINRWVTFVSYSEITLHLREKLPDAVYEYLPTAAGLLLIPFIVKPLDSLVEKVLDITIRPILIKQFPQCELEPIFGGEKKAREE